MGKTLSHRFVDFEGCAQSVSKVEFTSNVWW